MNRSLSRQVTKRVARELKPPLVSTPWVRRAIAAACGTSSAYKPLPRGGEKATGPGMTPPSRIQGAQNGPPP